jgi:hypothetical protein
MTVATSTDRSFKEGEKYLFLPHARNGEIFRDSDCSRTTRFRPALLSYRPEGPAEAQPPSSDWTDWWPLLLVAVIPGGLLLYLRFAR